MYTNHLSAQHYGFFPPINNMCIKLSIAINIYWFFWWTPVIFFFFNVPRSMQDLSFPTRNWTQAPCIGSVVLNHWTVKEVPVPTIFETLQRWKNLPSEGHPKPHV